MQLISNNDPSTMAAPSATKTVDQKSLHEDEVSQASGDPLIRIYQNIASNSSEWKAQHTSQLLRKVDLRLLPLLILMYLLNFLDRSNLAQARLGTLEEDLDMSGTDFNLATSILFVVRIMTPSHFKDQILERNKFSANCLNYRVTLACSYQPICYSPE